MIKWLYSTKLIGFSVGDTVKVTRIGFPAMPMIAKVDVHLTPIYNKNRNRFLFFKWEKKRVVNNVYLIFTCKNELIYTLDWVSKTEAIDSSFDEELVSLLTRIKIDDKGFKLLD